MKSKDVSLPVALCASFAVHVVLVISLAEGYVRAVGTISLPGAPRRAVEQAGAFVFLPVPIDREESLGRQDGTGIATDDSPGDVELQTPRIADNAQPALSLDPSGPGKRYAEPSPSVLPAGNGGDGGTTAPPLSADPAPPPVGASAIADASESGPPIFLDGNKPRKPTPPKPSDAQPKPPAPQPQPTAVVAQASSSESMSFDRAPGAPGSPMAAADPAPQGESESDAFAPVGSVEFRPGSMKAQIGRAHKVTRPRIDLGGLVDSIPIGRTRCVLKLVIDQSGRVTDVQIAESSRSNNIDQACRVAAFDWWFEPKLDKSGRPRASEKLLFTIEFR